VQQAEVEVALDYFSVLSQAYKQEQLPYLKLAQIFIF